MAYVAPPTRSAGALITAAIWNQDVVSNPIALHAGAMSISGQTAGDDIYASTATQLGRGRRALRQSFRGLHLRTHPDADVAASKVKLEHADEIILDDGTSVTDWDDLVADITVAGAGGLDTGSEGADRFYEIYAIRKSSDGTKNLLLRRAKDYFLDEQQTTDDSDAGVRKATAPTRTKIAQGIKVDTTGLVESVDVKLRRSGSVTGNIWFTLEADSSGNPSGTPLATSDKFDASVISTSAQWIRFVFRVPTSLTAATQYHLVLQGDYTESDTVLIRWHGVVAETYGNGDGKSLDSGTWTAISGLEDFAFKIYVTRNDTAVTMPSGYDQKCKIGYVLNDGSSNFVPFVAFDKRVMPLRSASLASVTATIMTLTDLSPAGGSSAIPPGPIRMWFSATNSGVTQNHCIGPVPNGYDFTNINPDRDNGIAWMFNSNADQAHGVSAAVLTEYQGVYLRVSGSTGTFWVSEWEWV